MAMTLTKEKDAQLARITQPYFCALALADGYCPFDREWTQAQKPGAAKPVNAVWMFLKWKNVDIAAARRLVLKAANGYEGQFLHRCAQLRMTLHPTLAKLDRYLTALSYQISGNVAWSLNCPRYHPDFCMIQMRERRMHSPPRKGDFPWLCGQVMGPAPKVLKSLRQAFIAFKLGRLRCRQCILERRFSLGLPVEASRH